ncbi:MAG: LacI family DNA-binding transcriptional regulator [Oscillospiraceae bacterium]|nr:LacI family DNA-binding transcriptional regulator [Oscillospiraceae bacterium]
MATIKDVARLAGVSISTVSKYLNGGNVRPEYAEQVRKAITELEYRANPYARSLKTPRAKSVGILLPNMKLDFFGNIITAMDKILRSSGYHTVISCYGSDHGLERDYLQFLLNNGIDGLVYVPEHLSAEEFKELSNKRYVPIIQVDRMIQGVNSDAVLSDNTDAAYAAVTRLIRDGHHRIALISSPASVFTARERMVGYLRALSDHHIPYDDTLVCTGEYSFTTGYQSFHTLTKLSEPPTAVFCVNYDMSIGVITAAQELGMHIPKDISVLGYDCVEICSLMSPPVPVIRQPEIKIGQTAGAFLLERLSGFDGPARIKRLGSELLF